MRIEFKSIKIENFFSLGNIELDLADRGYTLISGINKNPTDNAKSNGSGKTSIFNAIVWCLTGETIQGISSNIVNIHSDAGCKVELDFSIDTSLYKIIRSREHVTCGTTLKIFIDNEDKSGKGLRDTEQLLSQYLPDLTNDLLGAVIILGQGLPQRFTNNTPSGRKEVLEKLAKSDFMIDDIKEKLSSRQERLNSQIQICYDNILSATAKIESLNSIIAQAERSLANLKEEKDYIEIIDKLSDNIAVIDKKIPEISFRYNTQLQEYNKISQELSKQELQKQKAKSDVASKLDSEINNVRSKIAANNGEIRALQAEINRLSNISDICPTCGQKIPGVYKPDTSAQKSKLDLLTLQNSDLNIELTNLENVKKTDLDSIDLIMHTQLTDYSNQLVHLNEKLTIDKQAIDELLKNKENLNKSLLQAQIDKRNFEHSREDLRNQIESLSNQIEDLDNNILYNDNERVELESRLDIVNKMLTIAKRDFRGYLLSNVIDFINTKVKEYCLDIFNTTNLTFALDRNNITITYDNKPYENLSGGEKQKVDIIIQFAIRDMLCQFSNFSCNILCLDEIFDNIDAIGCEKVINLLSKKLSDVESMFIITHHSDIPISADSTIFIVKDEKGISNLL